jgi:hypothetical protein
MENFVVNRLSRKTSAIFCLILILTISFYYISGYRFTPIQAIMSNPSVQGDIQLFGEVDRDWIQIYLLETPDGLKTAVVNKTGFMWRCPSLTYFYDDVIQNDEVKTVGWASMLEKGNHKITVFAVQTTDPNVKFIEAGSDSDRQQKSIGLNETVIFVWDKTVSDLNAIAYNEDHQELYKYEYNPEHLNVTDPEELRWYPLNA